MQFTLLKNANVLFEPYDELQKNFNVLIKDNKIIKISSQPIEINQSEKTVIDVKNKTLMPGLIDAHVHTTGLTLSPKNIAHSPAEIAFTASTYLKNCLLKGFTAIREAGGADYKLAQLLTKKMIIGPRMFYSGKALTQTGGGADFRTPIESLDPCGHIAPFSVMSIIADGITEVRKAVREELRKGATQIKIFVSGGVVFPSEGLQKVYEYSQEELSAIVEEATARDTYVMAHAYTDESVRRCIKAGVRSIEHGNFISEETVELMAKHQVFLNPTFISLVQRIESAGQTGLSPMIVENLKHTIECGKRVYQYAKKHGVPVGLGTDLWGLDAQKEQLREFEIRKEFDHPANIIRSATTVNAEMLQQKGKLGIIAEAAYADLIVIDGDPLKDLTCLINGEKNLKLIMKDGIIYKNEL